MNSGENDSDTAETPNSASGAVHEAASRQRELTSAELLGGQQEVCIRHGNEVYRLRVTRNGKLILTK